MASVTNSAPMADDHQVEGHRLAAGADGQADRHDREEQVHDRVGHGGELDLQIEVGDVDVRRDQQHPRHGGHADRHHERVQQAGAVPPWIARVDHQQQARDEAGIDGEVQRVGRAREGHVPGRVERVVEREQLREHVVEEDVVVRHDIAGDEQELTDRDQVPGPPFLGSVDLDRDDDEDRRGQSDEVEQQAVLPHQVVDGRSRRGEHRIDEPSPLLHHMRYRVMPPLS